MVVGGEVRSRFDLDSITSSIGGMLVVAILIDLEFDGVNRFSEVIDLAFPSPEGIPGFLRVSEALHCIVGYRDRIQAREGRRWGFLDRILQVFYQVILLRDEVSKVKLRLEAFERVMTRG